MGRLISRTNTKYDAMIQWHTQVAIITTNIKVKIYFTLPELSAAKTVTWKCHVDDYAKVRYGMILGRYLLIDLVLNLRLSRYRIM